MFFVLNSKFRSFVGLIVRVLVKGQLGAKELLRILLLVFNFLSLFNLVY